MREQTDAPRHRSHRETVPWAPPTVPAKIAVLLVDTSVARREILRLLVESSPAGAFVVGGASNAVSAVESVASLGPDVVVLEIQLPVEAGLDALATLRRTYPLLPVVVCSFRADIETKARAIAAGAACFLPKPVASSELREALVWAVSLASLDRNEMSGHG